MENNKGKNLSDKEYKKNAEQKEEQVSNNTNNLNQSNMYAFTPITFVPFDTRLIAKELLTENEKNWLNEYHFKVRDIVKEHLSDFEISWLLKATAAI